MDVGPELQYDIAQKQRMQYGAKAENTAWAKNIKYMRRQLLKMLAGHMM